MKTTRSPAELLNSIALNYCEVTGVCSHTEDLTTKDIFIATGTGAAYVRQALDAGALAVICQADADMSDDCRHSENVYEVDDLDDFVDELLAKLYVNDIACVDLIGITGTNGKTSSAHFACQLFELLGVRVGYIGTLGCGIIGDKIHRGRNTTPDRITLYRNIASLSRAGCEKVILEVSSHGIALGRIAGLEFTTGVFTNLSRDHMDFHGTMQAYEDVKLSFFSEYSVDHLIVNTDDEVGKKLSTQWLENHCDNLSCYGHQEQSCDNYYLYDFRDGHIEVQDKDSCFTLRTSIRGRYNVENLMAAILICRASGYTFEAIRHVIASVESVPGRLECHHAEQGPNVCVDYAHTPAGMQAVLNDDSLLMNKSSQTWCIFGGGGDRDAGKRPLMGEMASRFSDRSVITDDNARGEQPEAIVCDIVAGFKNKAGLTICRDRTVAITHVKRSAATNDLVLVLGKGDERVIDYGVGKIPHRDMDVIAQAGVSR